MKKLKEWSWLVVCVLLLCGAILLIGCNKDNTNAIHEPSKVSPLSPNQPVLPESFGLAYSVNKDGKTCTITGVGTCADSNVVIPKTIDGYSVTDIGFQAFLKCKNITSIVIPDSVTSIGDTAFSGCDNLTNIVIPNSVTNIGDYAFSVCKSLTSITIPNRITSIGKSTFSGCYNLANIIIPDSVTNINKSAFYYCTNLTNITIPDSVINIGDEVHSLTLRIVTGRAFL